MLIEDLVLYENTRINQYTKDVKSNVESNLAGQSASVLSATIKSVMAEIESSKAITPLTIFQAEDKIRAAEYNYLMDAIQLDIKTIYNELDSMINLYKETLNYIKVSESNISKQINLSYTKVRSLSKLEMENKGFDKIEYDTFVDDRSEMIDDRLTVPKDSGLLRLSTFDENIVYGQDNDGTVEVVIPNYATVLQYQEGSLSSTDKSLGNYISIYSQEQQKVNYTIGTSTEEYNGLVYCVIIKLPSLRTINNYSFKPNTDAELDIIGLYTSTKSLSAIDDVSWGLIDTTYDTANYDSYEFNFEPIAAASIMLVLGQPHFTNEKIKVPKKNFITTTNIIETQNITDEFLLERLEKYKEVFSELQDLHSENQNSDAIELLLSQNNLIDNFGDLEDRYQRLLIGFAEFVKEDGSDYLEVSGTVYRIGVYAVKAAYLEYNNSGKYLTQSYDYDKNINAVQLSSRSRIPADEYDKDISNIEYNLIMNGQTVPIVPIQNKSGEFYTERDIFVISDVNDNRFDLRFNGFVDETHPIEILRNNTVLEEADFTPEMISDTLFDVVELDASILLNVNDVISIKYYISELDKFGKYAPPSVVNVKDKLPIPHVVDKNLYECDMTSVLLDQHGSGIYYTKYTCGDNINRVSYTPDGETTPSLYWYIEQDDVIEHPGYSAPFEEFYCGSGVYPTGSGYVVHPNCTIPSQTHAYYGIIDEEIESGTSASIEEYSELLSEGYPDPYDGVSVTKWEAENEYIPGTLSVLVNNKKALFVEYFTDTDTRFVDTKNYFFILENVSPSDTVKCSYVPIDEDADGQVTNIQDHNVTEMHAGNSQQNTIKTESIPYIDIDIVRNSISSTPEWVSNNGKFILKRNTSIVYIPMKITINGKILENKTDYQTGNVPEFSEYDERIDNIEFYHKDDVIYFNTKIEEMIDVRYYRLCTNFQLEIEMFRHRKIGSRLTPEVYDIATFIDLE